VMGQNTTAPCNAANPDIDFAIVTTFGTTIHANPNGSYTASDYRFVGASLSPSQFQKMTSYCGFIQANGSGYGICKSCREGAAGAARQ